MCGIAGIATFSHEGSRQAQPVVESMLELMRHRGPDDRGCRDLQDVVLGHLRLSILDLSQLGHQPMSLADGRYWITYNGEIYNYIELRKELESLGATFRSSGDTEVILHAYHHWGTDCFSRFNGMWALAIWDTDKKTLILCRDRLGIKPLYWCNQHGELAFGSEVKALAAYLLEKGKKLTLNNSSLATYVNSGLVDGLEETFFQGILRFKPGHLMVVTKSGVRRYEPYYQLPERALALRADLADMTNDQLSSRLHDLMASAVTLHSRSDVPVGVCLSGGLDSSAVAAMASRVIPELKSFTTWFGEGEEYNELEHSRKVVGSFGLDSHEARVDGGELLPKLGEMLWHLDEPTLAMGVFPHWHVMEAASRQVTVVMDGQGGDELFAGYDFYAPWFLYSRLASNDRASYETVLQGFSDNYGPQRAAQLEAEARNLLQTNASSNMPQHFPGRLDNFLLLELTQTRLPALLRYEDRLSMAFSIESRVPLLDYRLTELAFAINEEQKIGPGWSKYIMRQALDKELPNTITWRKDKKGFPTPFEVWAENGHKADIRGVLREPAGRLRTMMDPAQIEAVFQQWDHGQRNTWLLWRLLSLELWLRQYEARLRQELQRAQEQKREATVVQQTKHTAAVLDDAAEITAVNETQTVDELMALLQNQPGNAEAAWRLGNLMLKKGHLAQVGELLIQAAQFNQENHALHNLAGMALIQSGETQKALAFFQRAADVAPGNPSYQANLGKCMFLVEEWDQARQHLELALPHVRPAEAKEIQGLLDKIVGQHPEGVSASVQERPPLGQPSCLSIPPTPNPRQGAQANPYVDPDDISALAGHAVINGPSEIVGILERLVRHLRQVGVQSLSVNYGYNSWANYNCDINLDITKKPPQEAMRLVKALFHEALERFDVFHYHYARTYLPNLEDLDHLKQRDKKVVFSFYGNDQRSLEVYYYNQAKFLGYDPPKPYYLTVPLYNVHRMINRYADMIYSATGVPRGFFNQGTADTAQWDIKDKHHHLNLGLMDKDPDKLYVLHAPTDASLKGSGMLVGLLHECIDEGMPVQAISFGRRPLAEIKKLYAYADCAIDQVGAGTFGLFGIEMMCWEIPVLVYQTDLFRRVRNNPPVISITKENFKENILKLVEWKRSGQLKEFGHSCRKYAIENCDIARVGIPNYVSVYRDILEGKKVMQYINKSWYEEEFKLHSGFKSDFYRYMIENNVFQKIGTEIPQYDHKLYS